MKLLDLQSHIYNQNVTVGWWNNPRCFSTFVNLFHSEASEALEGHRKNLMDDKLPQYPMPVVEAADCAIRVFDYLGSVCNKVFCDKPPRWYKPGEFSFNLAYLHQCISMAWYEMEICNGSDALALIHLRRAIKICFLIIEEYGYDPEQIIIEKHKYNRIRPDHKTENRLNGEPGSKLY